ncbi:MAG TPA: penicillin-binding protein 2 [Aggregatilineales bacterium]|nr:penicillin-binding protein 2 [Aggregatilineales bacterium]
MKTTLNRRLSMLTFVLIAVGVLLLAQLASFQFRPDIATNLGNLANGSYHLSRDQIPDRGQIYDRNGELLAVNTMTYDIGASPVYFTDKRKAAHDLAAALNDDESRIYNLLNQDTPWVLLASSVSADTLQKVNKLNLLGIKPEAVPQRVYPQNSLAAQVIGFVGGKGSDRHGYIGIEGQYEKDLAGQSRFVDISQIPFETSLNDQPPPGRDIYLTIDRSVQALAEIELKDAVDHSGAVSGSVIIMDPRNGEILAMASYPNFNPNDYYKVDPLLMNDPAISAPYEPGSVFKIVTLSVALELGKDKKIDLNWTYYDTPVFNKCGIPIYNWDRGGHGSQTFSQVLIKSWNIGTSNIVDQLGPTLFYTGLEKYGVGQPTGIDLEGEAAGVMRKPGDTYWSDCDLYSNSFGQGLTVTPLQMLTFANTIANGGRMMQPHIRLKLVDNGKEIPSEPFVIRTPISQQTAQIMTNIMVQVVSLPEGEGHKAVVPGYTVAGKTGTAQIYNPAYKNGYDPDLQEGSFVGFLPADEPRVSILIKLDKIGNYASQTAAPAFAHLVQRLVVLMGIPSDEQRAALRAQGGNTALINGVVQP